MRFCAAGRISQCYLPLRTVKAGLPGFRTRAACPALGGAYSGSGPGTARGRIARAPMPATRVWLSYNDPAWIAERHGLGEPSAAAAATLRGAITKLAHAATGA